MQAGQSLRHTRRGFFRGDATPKFYPLVPLKGAHVHDVPDSLVLAADARAPQIEQRNHQDILDFNPHPQHLLHLDGSLSAPTGNAFLSWLADQITGQAVKRSSQVDQSPAPRAAVLDFTPDDYDPHIDFLLDDKSLLTSDHAHECVDLSYELEASYTHEEEQLEFAHLSAHIVRGKLHPDHIEAVPDGTRVEYFFAGSRVVKDVLGRVVEVQSQYGDCLYLRYGIFGNIDAFQRTDCTGRAHSEGRKDKHGVVVRDPEGRVRAAGESMSIDPRGCFYLHGINGQYFSLDLVSGIHSERRRISDERGSRFVTSLFTHDGFRMATMFGPSQALPGTTPGADPRQLNFRFYGRDGTVIEFASEDDLLDLRPLVVSAPATRAVHKAWPSRRQAVTAWESVHDYLMRVS
ncbi:MAG TPA: hypothetical protein V6D22_01750 [Candidatus Obscuribacterales bacterium]